jgi:hypothetical protein
MLFHSPTLPYSLITLANFTRTASSVFGDILVLVLMGLVRMKRFLRGELARSVPVSDSILTHTTKPPSPFRSVYQKGNAYVWSRQKTYYRLKKTDPTRV